MAGTLAAISLGGASAASASPVNAYAAQAAAAGLTEQQSHSLQSQVDDQMKRMKPGAVQVSANQIRTADGDALITLPLPGEKVARAINAAEPISAFASCPYKYMCLYDGTGYTGLMMQLYTCKFYNLGDVGLNDRLSSYINNQTPGTAGDFYNWEEFWAWKFSSAGAYSQQSLLGSPYNNYIDGVYPCYN
ncbi:peptidase inhibitor family I36 protein [Planotetraspora sp. A-T 1434]|uniref:peptidase inhibitor family I36 protein n=1 Tax=Planotetraspora sp. A-T 1434 TaxID=2979219 RepID=UPI0021BE356F|nr:peptidase inhibitor family I36 protein [Planotetraspora sp. A-T 1434]MCT9935430.1 peptidase inhibitor family I36 protein [Planotetraspora sp. A-T 1434]